VSTGGKPGPAHSGNIFALGDVADTPGPKMARAGMMQAEVARGNICALINGQSPASLMPYVPMAMEGHLALSLGRDGSVMYMQQEDGSEVLQPGRGKGLDLEVGMMWWRLGAKMDIKESNAKM
jgi:NADH dehydrogenase FAD-containing subunit